MALRSLMLNKSINEKRSALEALEAIDFQTRETEIATAIEEAASDVERSAVEEAITAFETAKTETENKKENLRTEIAALEKELADIEAAAPAEAGKIEKPIEERKDEHHMTIAELRSSERYLNAYADYLKTGKEAELRSLLTENSGTIATADSGPIPVPTYVEGLIRQAWENDEIMRLVRRTYMAGNVKVGFEISATDAVFHAEGTDAPAEEIVKIGVASIIPQMAKKWISVSHEALDLNGQALIDYVFDEITYKIIKLLADALIYTLAENTPETSTATTPGQALIAAAPALGTVAQAIAQLSDQAANPVIVMNKGTWAKFKEIQYAGNYAVDPFEGLPVVFNSSLPVYDESLGDEVYMIVGDFGVGAQANFPNGDDVKLIFDEYSLAEQDLVKIVGRLYVGLGIVAPNAFCRVVVSSGASDE